MPSRREIEDAVQTIYPANHAYIASGYISTSWSRPASADPPSTLEVVRPEPEQTAVPVSRERAIDLAVEKV